MKTLRDLINIIDESLDQDPITNNWRRSLIDRILSSNISDHDKRELVDRAKSVRSAVDAELIHQELDDQVDEGSMTDAEHNPSGPKFGGYYGATQKGPPRPGQGAGGCEESVDNTDEQIEEDAADDVIALANEIKRD